MLRGGDHIRQEFEMALGETSETVTVEGTSSIIQVQSAEIQGFIQNQQVGSALEGARISILAKTDYLLALQI